MRRVLVTGSGGLVGSEAVRFFANRGWQTLGVDNDMRAQFFGPGASTAGNLAKLRNDLPFYQHLTFDIRDKEAVERAFLDSDGRIDAIIHTAAQPSHDWAARDPHTDFHVNAVGTLNLLESARRNCPEAPFIFVSTNKVYGDTPNRLPVVELHSRYELDPSHDYAALGINESMSIDATLHSLFGVSKAAADLLVQEYGSYFGMPTVTLRCGCLTGPAHAGAELHGFLAYLAGACVAEQPYTVFGYKAKQVRDNLHAQDLVSAFGAFVQSPTCGEIYNLGGGRASNCSMLEAIELVESHAGCKLRWRYTEEARIGDHRWWITDTSKFQTRYPEWEIRYNLNAIIEELVRAARMSQKQP